MANEPRRWTIPLRVTLMLGFAGLLLATVGAIGMVSYISVNHSIKTLSMSLGHAVSNNIADRVRELLEPAQKVLYECRTTAQRGLLAVDEPPRLSDQLVERLRYERNLSWLCYGDAQGRFTGAWRRNDGKIVLNRSWIETDGGRLIEEVVEPDGSRILIRQRDDWTYDPRNRPFYPLASGADGLVWTPPYEWWDGEGLGITAALALRDEQGVHGVFTADFHLQALRRFLHRTELRESGGRVYLLTRQGKVIASPEGSLSEDESKSDPVLTAALLALPVALVDLPVEHPIPYLFHAGGVRYAAVFHAFDVPGGVEWTTVMIVPASNVFGFIERNRKVAAVMIALVVLLAIALALLVSSRVTRPLQRIADDLRHVARFELTDQPVPPSRISEIDVVGQATGRMKSSLRSFGRYVPRDLVRDLLDKGHEARLGVESRELTIFFSDIEGFSRLCEVIPPDLLVQMSREYFTLVEASITRHRGTVDKFIGDGVLAFFNAPEKLPAHASVACATALDILASLPVMRRDWEPRGNHVTTRTRIGLHTGRALVGNIGTDTRFHYTVVGDTVNLAYGYQVLNKVYGSEVIAGQETRDAAGDHFEWRRLDLVAVKGRSGSAFLHELLGRRGQVGEDALKARDLYENGLDAYLRRQFDQAIKLFDHVLAYWPDDRAAPVLRDRARAFVVDPPPDQWQGAFAYTIAPVGQVFE